MILRGFGSCVATFWEIVAPHVVKPYVPFVLCLFVILFISYFGFASEALNLIAIVPDHCLPFYLSLMKMYNYLINIGVSILCYIDIILQNKCRCDMI